MENRFKDYLKSLKDYDEDLTENVVTNIINETTTKCMYIDLDMLENKPLKWKEIDDIMILQINIQSLPSKFDNFNMFLQNISINAYQPHIILLCETFLTV